MNEIFFKIGRLGFQVLHHSLYPICGVTFSTDDKDLRFRRLKRKLGARGSLMFAENSSADSSASALDRFGMGMIGWEDRSGLKRDYASWSHLEHFFEALLKNNVESSEETALDPQEEVRPEC